MWDGQTLMQGSCQVAVRVDQAKAAPSTGIFQRHVQQECRFASAGLTDDMQVMHPVLLIHAKGLVTILVPRNTQRNNVVLHDRIVWRGGRSR
jgi:hypothetical protein